MVAQGPTRAVVNVGVTHETMTVASRSIFTTRLQTPNVWVFPGRNGKHVGQHQRLWDRVIQRAGLTCVPYDLRHTFATRAVERGVALPKLMAILGHSNLRSIMKYVHMAQQHINEGMARFESANVPEYSLPSEQKARVQ